jgi:hypothetical protein
MCVFTSIPRRAAANCRREKGAGAAMIRLWVVESVGWPRGNTREQCRTSVTDRETWQTELKTRRLRDARCQHKYPIPLSTRQPDPFIAGLVLDADILLSALPEPRFSFCRLRTGRGWRPKNQVRLPGKHTLHILYTPLTYDDEYRATSLVYARS